MRMSRVRFTIRCAMLCVLGFGIALHLAFAAWQVYSTKGYHSHGAIVVGRDGVPATYWKVHAHPPFWPRYWRCLVGLPWKGQPLCHQDEDLLLEVCQLAHPEIIKQVGPLSSAMVFTQSQVDLLRRTQEGQKVPVTYEDSPLKY